MRQKVALRSIIAVGMYLLSWLLHQQQRGLLREHRERLDDSESVSSPRAVDDLGGLNIEIQGKWRAHSTAKSQTSDEKYNSKQYLSQWGRG